MNSQSFSNTKVFKVLKNKVNTGSNPKLTGVAVPVFSLNTKNNFGIGEFLDLKMLGDWCEKVGMKMIQILPINDTRTDDSWDNSYPYKAISTKALHPIYLNLEKIGKLQEESDRAYFENQKNILKEKDHVDYPEVMKVKDAYFKKIFAQDWESTKNTEDFQNFFKENKDWLVPYAEFCLQPTVNGQQPEFYYFLQYHLDKQLKEAVDYLHERGIALKGDIPIGIGRHSVEAWTNPELFNLDCQAGAPPDAFATEGQNWGFPTYNWNAMANDNYQWWRDRLTQMSRYFDAYRIDHILGFFRIWEIPQEHTQGIMGHFSPALSYQQSVISSQLSASYERLTKPYIRGHFLHEFFGEFTEEVRDKYLNETSFSYFELKEDFNTQRKITDFFVNRQQTTDNCHKDEKIKNGLIALCAEVLFLEDKNGGLHPVKAAVSIPVATVGKVLTVENGEQLLADGDADIIAYGRSLLCDPDIAIKAESGEPVHAGNQHT